MSGMNRSPKKLIVLSLLAGTLVVVYLVGSQRWSPFVHHATAETSGKDRKVLFWYDAMNPAHHYNQPGKAPDGMDLVPTYADATTAPAKQNSSSSSSEMTNAPAISTDAGERKILFWYDAMNSQHHFNQAGKAPDGMDLVPRYAGDQSLAKMAAGTVVIPADRQVLAGVRTSLVERKALVRDVRTTAEIIVDETLIAHVHVKVAGYIDKVYVDYVGQMVKKGDALFTLYSPDLVSTEEEYLIAKRGNNTLGNAPFKEVAEGAQSLFASARERLKLWDISDQQIKQLDESGKVNKDLTFYSPISGFVTDRKAFPQTSVSPDTELYTVSDLSTVWATADIYENEVPFVRVGQKVTLTMSYYEGKRYTATISYIYPTVDPQTRTVKVRMQIPNPGFALKPQMFADAQIRVDYGTKVLIPEDAVLDSGTEQRVYVVHPGGVFEPRKVTLGPVIDGNVAVLTGLKPGETVVTSGNFLVDSESKLKSTTVASGH